MQDSRVHSVNQTLYRRECLDDESIIKHHTCDDHWPRLWRGIVPAPRFPVGCWRMSTGVQRPFALHGNNGGDLRSALHPQTILDYAWNDRPLMTSHGAPLQLYSPIKLGYKLTRYLTRMTFTRERPGGYWEDQGYPWFAGL